VAVPQSVMRAYDRYRSEGKSIRVAADLASISPSTAMRHERAKKAALELEMAAKERQEGGPPKAYEDLNRFAKRAFEDFAFFQQRYFGRIAMPWQEDAAYQIQQYLASPEKEFVVLNAPPGSGKTTTFIHDIPAWLTIRDRALRGQIGSKTMPLARRYVANLRRDFERTTPILAKTEELELGLAVDAVATLQQDFGRFKPEHTEKWSNDEFIVSQLGDILLDEKESTWTAFGFDTAFIGGRYDIVVWDDVVDRSSMRNIEIMEKIQGDWDDVAETRLEPAGLLLLQGQRLGPADLYRYNLNKMIDAEIPEDMDEDDPALSLEPERMYHHVVYKAHYPELCQHHHKKTDPPYNPAEPTAGGCLLDPRRLSWRDLRQKMANTRGNFSTLYQQEDSDPANVLVHPVWIHGGTDPDDGSLHPGCLDITRDIWEYPHNVDGDLFSYVTVDPSPTRLWSIQHWCVLVQYGPENYEIGTRYLIDVYNGKLGANQFLDRAHNDLTTFTGLAEEWQQRSARAGHPIRWWILEKNAAQRWIFQYEHTRDWAAKRNVLWVPHETTMNKHDPEYGVRALIPRVYSNGIVNIPYKNRNLSMGTSIGRMVGELTHWPDWGTEDNVMSNWFGEAHIGMLIPRPQHSRRRETPRSLMRNASTYPGREWAGQTRGPGGATKIFSALAGRPVAEVPSHRRHL
jgi:hypothetical protein